MIVFKEGFIITSPYIANGGVAQFIKNLAPFFSDETIVFKRGKRKKNQSLSALLPFIDIARFFFFIIPKKSKKVIVNTSLSKVGLLRDGLFVFIAKLFKKEVVLYIHGFEFSALSNNFLLKNGYFKSDKIFVLSEEFKRALIDKGCKKDIFVTNNPVNIDLIKTAKELGKDYDTTKKIKVLMISRIIASKGIFIGIETAKQLQNENVEFHIAGTGEDLEKAKTLVEKEKITNVIFHGFVSGGDKLNLLKDTDVLFFPTYHNEGLPINILESLVMGLYVITRPVAGIVDLSKHYKMTLTESVNAEDYVTILKSILVEELDYSSIKENQQQSFIDFSPKQILKKIAS